MTRLAFFLLGVVAGWFAAIGVREHLDQVDEVDRVVSRPAHLDHAYFLRRGEHV